MNYYFLLEDEKSFIKVLPEWLKYMGIQNTRVQDITYVRENNYVMQSGQGVTQLITRVLFQTIDTILLNPGKIDELIVILDSEEYNEQERKKQVENIIKEYIEKKKQVQAEPKRMSHPLCSRQNGRSSYKVFVCNHCFETWLLGNGNLYPDIRPEGDFQPYYDKYNIKVNDPELMAVPDDIKETIAVYHFHYLHEMCRYNRVRYSKKKPMEMAKKVYFDALVSRIDNSDHLHSFAQFYEYFVNEQK